MIVEDVIYGKYKIENILEELILTKEVQRLKKVHMAGASFLRNELWNETRYEHSIGTMLLTRKLGGSLEAQIAALLHDVSHTAFSHTMDKVLKYSDEDYHEIIKDSILYDSKIPKILSKYGYSLSIIKDDTQFPILEKELPSLCADRIDYTLRAANRYYDVNIHEIHAFIESLIVCDNEVCVKTLEQAEWFMKTYNLIVLTFFYEPESIIANYIMVEILKYALKQNYVSKKDLMLDDFSLIDKLKSFKDDYIQHMFNIMGQKMNYTINHKEISTIVWYTKPRILDSTICIKSEKIKGSLMSQFIREEIDKAYIISKEGLSLNVSDLNGK